MLVMRPAQAADLPQVQRLAVDSPVGVTSLSDDIEHLRDKIPVSEAPFVAEASCNGEESYFFVLKDSASGELVGCSAIVASAEFSEPLYSLRGETSVHALCSLSIYNKVRVLSLCHDLAGNNLLTSFYVQHDLVQSVYTGLNSRDRLLFMASHPERFVGAVVVETVDYSDEQGESPFWNTVRRNFSDPNYIETEKFSRLKSHTLLTKPTPHYPVYVLLLPDAAQESMGQVHLRAQIISDILICEGLEIDNYIDTFDGGPTLHARIPGTRSIAQSRMAPVKIDEVSESKCPCLVINGQLQGFRAVALSLDWAPGRPAALSVEAAEALGIGEGASIRLVAV